MELPGYRELPDYSTYQDFPVEELPPIPIDLDNDCAWLLRIGTPHLGDGLHRHERAFPPLPPATVEELATQSNLELPHSFRRFMISRDLQSRVCSCTGCYLDPGQRIVETTGSLQGHLVHFLSDSQSCAHWYLHILSAGLLKETQRIVLDLAAVEHIDSNGLGTLVASFISARRIGGEIKFADLSPRALRALTSTNVNRLFDVCHSTKQAIRSFHPRLDAAAR
jgi:anti-anti-sigma factor